VKNWTTKALAPLGVFACLGLSGCLFTSDDGNDDYAYDPIGSLTVEWTIDGQRNPADCADFAVDRLELVLYDGADQFVDEFEPVCESFGMTVDLEEGLYYGDATLVDSFDQSATVTEPLEDIDIVGGTDLVISVDFPIDSFL
jgi:hypothetical protein